MRRPTPSAVAELDAVTPFENGPRGIIYVNFADEQLEFTSKEALDDWVLENAPKRNHAKAILLTQRLRADYAMSNPVAWRGAKVTVNPEAPTVAGVVR